MRVGSRVHRFWLWWNSAEIGIGRFGFFLPQSAWRVYCAVRGHSVTNAGRGRPEQRICIVCESSQPLAEVTC